MSEHAAATNRRCWIRLGGHEVEVRAGRTVLGRHISCQVILNDPLASRRHARLDFDGGLLVVEDMGSINGVLVNGVRVSGKTILTSGDEVRLGNQRIVVLMEEGTIQERRSQQVGHETLTNAKPLVTAPPDVVNGDNESTVVRQDEALETLSVVAEKVLAMGRGKEAERILQASLKAVLMRALNGAKVEADTLALAAMYAIRIAESTHRGAWIDYVFELYGACGRVLPVEAVDRLYNAVRTVQAGAGLNMTRLRAYISMVRSQEAQLGPAERFQVRRIEGLERVALS